MGTAERKKWLKWSKIRIILLLEDEHTNKKEINMENTLTGLIHLQEGMATNVNKFLRVRTIDSYKENKYNTKSVR